MMERGRMRLWRLCFLNFSATCHVEPHPEEHHCEVLIRVYRIHFGTLVAKLSSRYELHIHFATTETERARVLVCAQYSNLKMCRQTSCVRCCLLLAWIQSAASTRSLPEPVLVGELGLVHQGQACAKLIIEALSPVWSHQSMSGARRCTHATFTPPRTATTVLPGLDGHASIYIYIYIYISHLDIYIEAWQVN